MRLLSRRDLACQQAVELVTDYLEGSLPRSARRRLSEAEQRDRAARYADQMIFEGFVPGT